MAKKPPPETLEADSGAVDGPPADRWQYVPLKPHLTFREVLAVVPPKRATVLVMIKAGIFPEPLRCGWLLVWRRQDIVNWLEALDRGEGAGWRITKTAQRERARQVAMLKAAKAREALNIAPAPRRKRKPKPVDAPPVEAAE